MSRGGKILRFIPDTSPIVSSEFEYSPNVAVLNSRMIKLIKEENLDFAGFVHSHLNNALISKEDKEYMQEILTALSADSILCGVFNTATAELRWYEVTK